MSNVVPISKDPIKNLSDTKFSEIEKDLNVFLMRPSAETAEIHRFLKQKNMQ